MAESSAAGRIAVDAMGGDLGPAEVVEAAKLALAEYPGLIPLTLVGDVAVLRPLLQKAGLADHPTLALSHASEIITMDDKPLLAIRRKKDSSMMRAIELVKHGEAIAAVSCGNTGSLVAAGIPLTPAMKTLPEEGLIESFPAKLGELAKASGKPVVCSVACGSLYEPYVAEARKHGLPVFRSADRALRAMAAFCRH